MGQTRATRGPLMGHGRKLHRLRAVRRDECDGVYGEIRDL